MRTGQEVQGGESRPWLGSVSLRKPPEDAGTIFEQPDTTVTFGPVRLHLPPSAPLPPVSVFRSTAGLAFFSGFLLNRDDLSADLPAMSQERAAEVSDAELVWQAYSRWKRDSFLKLQGTFAVAVWDEQSRQFHMARDSGGLHPLFYWLQDGRLLFSWSIQEIARQPGVPKALNRVVLAEHVMSRWIDQDATFWKGILRVPAGHVLELSDRGKRVERYWDPMPEGREIEWVNDEELREFPALLQKAVERTLRFGQTGILLSGGFDSVSVAACAADWTERTGGPLIKAYSMRFPGNDDEVAVQSSVAQRLGLTQHFDELSSYQHDPGLLAGTVAMGGELPSPPFDLLKPAYVGLLRRAREQGCQVALTGEGGDEWLTVTPVYAADLIARGQFLRLARLLRMTLKFWTIPVLPGTRNIVWTNGFRPLLRERMRRTMPSLARARRRRLLARGMPDWLAPEPQLRAELTERFLERWRSTNITDSHYLTETRFVLRQPFFEIVREERFFRDIKAGIPSLHPYLDRELIEFLLRVPPESLIRGGQSKALVRETMEQRFPELGFAKQKKVTATNSFLETYRREVPPLWDELGRFQALADLGVMDPELAKNTLRMSWDSSNIFVWARSWILSSAEAWVRTQNKQIGVRASESQGR